MTFRCWSRVAFAGAGLLFFSIPSVHAQQGTSYHDLLIGLRDTVTSVEAAVWEFNRDLGSAGRETVLSRASHLQAQCRVAGTALSGARERLRPASAGAQTRRSATGLMDAISRLERTLRDECLRGFREGGSGNWADSLRAWAPYRGNQITKAIRAYETAASGFAAAAGFALEPRMPGR